MALYSGFSWAMAASETGLLSAMPDLPLRQSVCAPSKLENPIRACVSKGWGLNGSAWWASVFAARFVQQGSLAQMPRLADP